MTTDEEVRYLLARAGVTAPGAADVERVAQLLGQGRRQGTPKLTSEPALVPVPEVWR